MSDVTGNFRGKERLFVRIIEAVSTALGEFSGVLVVLMVALVLYEAFMRYVLDRAPLLADEISAYMYIALTFLGLAYTLKKRSHVRVKILPDRLSAKAAYRLRSISLVIAFALSVLFTKLGYDMTMAAHNIGMRSGSWLAMPMDVLRGFFFIGFLWLSLQLIAEFIKHMRSPER